MFSVNCELFSVNSSIDFDFERIHDFAEGLGLEHFSRGTKERFITVRKKSGQRIDEFQYFGYLGLMGPSVDKAAETGIDLVKSSFIQNRYFNLFSKC